MPLHGFLHLKKFVKKEGHARVPYSYISNDGYHLGSWIRNQKFMAKMEKMNLERKSKLEALCFVYKAR